MVREADATALVADAAQALARRGYDPVITDANSVRLIRLGALMLAEFGCGRDPDNTEADDG
jgi:O-methyltransferase involved in polyketide biosynthesis